MSTGLCDPSIHRPYLFYFDYGSYKIFGSSPEAQIQIKNGEASIYPIAGTFRRSGNDKEDSILAAKLTQDEKENSEHVMLVDLARNDLSRDSKEVKVEVFKEVQYYSHVIHLVSKVTGKLRDGASPLQLAADTFPAGTLSGVNCCTDGVRVGASNARTKSLTCKTPAMFFWILTSVEIPLKISS